jgi:dihydroneopterin aldolase
MTIHLKDLHFFGFHGVYLEEQILGNEFIVNIKVTCNPFFEENILLEQTVNYEEVFNLVKKIMNTPTPLLESLVVKIGNTILAQYSQVLQAEVSIYKKNPPIKDYQGNVGVHQLFERK